MPSPPAAHLVMVKPGLVLGLLEALLDPPARTGDPGQIDQGGSARPETDVVGDLTGRLARTGDLASSQQPVPAPGHPADADRDTCPVVVVGPVRAGTHRQPPP